MGPDLSVAGDRHDQPARGGARLRNSALCEAGADFQGKIGRVAFFRRVNTNRGLPARGTPVRHSYYEAVLLIERVHRHFLEVIKTDLDRQNIQDINNVQALILYNIGPDEMTV